MHEHLIAAGLGGAAAALAAEAQLGTSGPSPGSGGLLGATPGQPSVDSPVKRAIGGGRGRGGRLPTTPRRGPFRGFRGRPGASAAGLFHAVQGLNPQGGAGDFTLGLSSANAATRSPASIIAAAPAAPEQVSKHRLGSDNVAVIAANHAAAEAAAGFAARSPAVGGAGPGGSEPRRSHRTRGSDGGGAHHRAAAAAAVAAIEAAATTTSTPATPGKGKVKGKGKVAATATPTTGQGKAAATTPSTGRSKRKASTLSPKDAADKAGKKAQAVESSSLHLHAPTPVRAAYNPTAHAAHLLHGVHASTPSRTTTPVLEPTTTPFAVAAPTPVRKLAGTTPGRD